LRHEISFQYSKTGLFYDYERYFCATQTVFLFRETLYMRESHISVNRNSVMGGPKNSFCHLKLIEKMSFYLNLRAHKGSVLKTGTVFGTVLMTEIPAFRKASAGMTNSVFIHS
jgi:hypothetical protein